MRDTVIIFKNARFTFLSEHTFKAEYASQGRFIGQELFVTEINHTVPVVLERVIRGKTLILKTKYLTIQYDAGTEGFHRRNLKVLYHSGSRREKWYFGKKDRRNLLGSMLHLFKFPKFTKHTHLSQGALSRNGFFAYYDRTYTYWTRRKDWAEIHASPGNQTLFFSGYGRDYRTGLLEFSRIFGRAPLPPIWAFGFWYSRWYAYHQDEFKDLVKKYRSLGIPLDVLVVDTDWRRNVWNGYDWAEKYFPEPDKFIREMKKLGIKLTLNDHPGYNNSEPLPATDSHFPKIKKYLKHDPGGKWACNWGDRKEVKAFLEILIKPKLKMGIDSWWIDGWGADGIYRNEEFFRKHRNADRMALGSSGYETLNPQMWLNHFYYKATEEATKKRPLVLTRWGGIGSHRYPVWFSGDTYSTWKTLAYQVYFTPTAGNVLTHYWSHDLGGFLGRTISKELFLRWAQFGAFSPIMRTHSEHGVREPWNFDQETVEVFRKYVRLRYRLVPYFYSCAFLSYLEGLPLVRTMYHNYPDEKMAYQFKHQYMIGDFILVAPVVKKGKRKKVYFPPGEWIGMENLFVTMGPAVQKLDVPLSQIPVFIKKGAIIPIAQTSDYIGQKKNDTLRIEIFPDQKSEFTFYEDDGTTKAYLKGHFIRIKITVLSEEGWIKVSLGKQQGHYIGLIKRKKLQIVIHSLKEREIKKAVIGHRQYKVKKTTRIFNEILSVMNSYEFETFYIGKPLSIVFYNETREV